MAKLNQTVPVEQTQLMMLNPKFTGHEKNKIKQGPYSFMDEIVIDFFAI